MSTPRKKPAAKAKAKRNESHTGPGWLTVFCFSAMSFAAGGATATVALESAATLDEFKARNIRAEAPPPPLELVSFDKPGGRTKPQFFPETNRVDWSISLRPGVPTIPVKLDNLSKRDNHRVLFQVLSEDRDPQLAAVLYVRANGKAIIQLPPAEYRLDVVSTSINMDWDIAKDQYASPRLKMNIESDQSAIIAQKHLEITDGGSLRRRKGQTIRAAKSDLPVAPDEPQEKQEIDYGDIEIPDETSTRPKS
ncbi:hypothetical protein [Erythrobacter aureus]|uniref:Uncharacterized protein n=1 Tax=Erythrobacter aureus TaxID=2182384 RepID=A0A345YIJ9_9SPHN|nr:hypothetical protein [Erythrobacter aureus]AXK43751.1 hypothetical protein DVR09_14940 [Erythrobacter aureus]